MAAPGDFAAMIASVNRFLERWIILILPLVLLAGFQLGEPLHPYVRFVPTLFMYLTFVASMNVTRSQLKELWANPKAVVLVLALMHVGLPFIHHELIAHLYAGSKELKLGIMLAMIMPIGVTSIVWVSLSKGNVGIAISLVTLDTLLSPLLIPLTLWALAGESVQMDAGRMILGVAKLVVLPSILGMIAGQWLHRRKRNALRPVLALSSKLTLYLIVLLNAAAMSASLTALSGKLLPLLAAVLGLMLLGYLLVWIGLQALKLTSTAEIAFTYAGGIRNYTAGIVIAQLYFAPETAIPVMFAILLQHPIALIAHVLFGVREKLTVMKKRLAQS